MLASLTLVLFGELLIPTNSSFDWQSVFRIQSILVGSLLFSQIIMIRWLIISVLVSIVTFELLSWIFEWEPGKTIVRVLFIGYFLLISFKVYRDIYRAKDVNAEIISAVFCGFIILGLISSLFFFIIESNIPDSFSNLGDGLEKMQNLQYFSFITLMTIGYGDIVPLTMLAKKTVLLTGLLGTFYTVFVMGIIIGKFLKN
jgi:hypothetical protein